MNQSFLVRSVSIFSILMFCILSNAFGQNIPSLDASLKVLNPENILHLASVKAFDFRDKNKATTPASFSINQAINEQPIFTSEVFKASASHADVQTTWTCNGPIKKGDVLLIRFAMRAVYAKQESGDAIVSLFFQEKKGDRLVNIQLGTGQEWKVFDVPFIANNDKDAGQSEITLTFGQLAQKVEVAGIQVLNFGKKATLAQLPITKFTYAGREENAAWRNDALRRIEEIRTASLIIRVKGANGKAVKGVKVEAKLIDPEFIFGTAVSARLLAKEMLPDSKVYRKNLSELFNAVTIDNGLKWGGWINPESRQVSKEAIDWITDHHLHLRGHNLVWPGKKFTPPFYSRQPNFGPGFSDSITNHIKDIASYTKGKVYGWDVINEMLHEKDYFEVMPRTQAVEWFKQAKRIDPEAQLFINEYSMLNGISSPQNIKSYLDLIAELRNGGAPIDAVGVQGHVGRQPRNPEQVISDLNLFKPLGLPVHITEFDVNTPDEQLQADYTRDFVIACYSHPTVTGFTMWGFWEAAHWKPDAAMFKKDWTAKPNLAVWRDLVLNKWRTSINATTKADGAINERGHFGKYEITITKGKATKKIIYQLSKTSAPVNVAL